MAHDGLSLPTLWLPLTASTAGLGKDMEEAGRQAKTSFDRGFSGQDFGTRAGKDFTGKFIASITSGLRESNVGSAATAFAGKFTEQVDAQMAASLKGKLPGIYREATRATEELRAAEQRAVETRKQAIASIEQNKQAQVRATEDVARATVAARAALVAYREAEKAGKLSTEELTAASLKSVTATNELAQAKVRLREATTAQHRADQEARDAVKEVGAAHERATAATEQHHEAVEQYTAASGRASSASAVLGGMMGGAVVLGAQAVVHAFEDVIETGEHIFEKAIESAHEFADEMVELGGFFEGINNQVTMFSGASGEALDSLKEHADALIASLDVSGADVGKTMAMLGTRLEAEAGPALDAVTKTLTELEGRWGDLRSEDVGAIFMDWGMGINQAGAALDTLVQNSQQAGADVGQVAAAMKGPLSEVLQEAGLSFGQVAHAAALLTAQGIPTNDAIRAVGGAAKFAKEHGMTLNEVLKETKKEMEESKDPADANALAVDVFGMKANEARPLLEDLLGVIDSAPDKFDGMAGAADRQVQATQTLETRIQALTNTIHDMFKPMGEASVDVMIKAVENLEGAWSTHTTAIKGFIVDTGATVIQLARGVEDFAELSLRMLEPVAEVFKLMGQTILGFMAQMQPLGKLLEHIPGMQGLGHAMEDAGTAAANMYARIGKVNVTEDMGRLADWMHNHKIDVNAGTEAWSKFYDTASGQNAPPMREGFTPWWPSAGSAPGGGGEAPGGGGGEAPGGGGGGGGAPGGAPAAPGGGKGSAYHANWDLIAGAESSGDWHIDHGEGPNVSGGLQIGSVAWISHGGGAYAPQAYMANEEQQKAVAEKILADPEQGPKAWPTTYANHPDWFQHAEKGLRVTGGIKGKDSVPILAQHGEFVVNKDSYDKYSALIDFMNANPQGFEGGGIVAAEQWASSVSGQPYTYGNLDCSGVVASAWGIITGKGPGHWFDTTKFADNASAAALGFMPGTMPGAFNIAVNPEPGEQGHMMAEFPDGTFFESGGKDSTVKFGGNTSNFGGFEKHFYLAGMPQAPGSGGAQMAGFGGGGGSGGGGGDGSIGPHGERGRPGQYGGYGTYGGETQDEAEQHDRNVRHAKERVDDIQNKQIPAKQAEIDKLQKQYDTLNAVTGERRDQAKLDELQGQIKDANDQLDKLKNETLPEAQQDVGSAQRHQAEAADKMPEGGSEKGKRSSMDGEARSLGGSLLGGISQSLGFPDVFGGKSPKDWGIVKLLGGLASWGFGEFNALGDAGGRLGGQPQGMGPNLVDGMAGSVGMPGFRLPQPPVPGLPVGAPVIGAPPVPGQDAPHGEQPAVPGGPLWSGTPKPVPSGPGPGNAGPLWSGTPKPVPSGFTRQTPAGAPGSIVPKPPGHQPISFSKGLPKEDVEGPNLFGNRYQAGFDDGKGGRMAAPQGAPWASTVDSLTTMALSFAAKAVPGVGGKGSGFQMSGTGGGAGGDGGQGQPLGATGIMQTTGSVPTFYGGGGGDTHNHNYGDNIQHIDNSRTWNVAPKSDSTMVQHLQNHDNAQRSNAALASAPGTLQSYP
jgi:hypothetical protein